jgi:hypothetical protein
METLKMEKKMGLVCVFGENRANLLEIAMMVNGKTIKCMEKASIFMGTATNSLANFQITRKMVGELCIGEPTANSRGIVMRANGKTTK